MLPGGRTEPAVTLEAPTGKRRKISAAARKRMKEGQQRRWAKIRGEAESPSSAVTPEPTMLGPARSGAISAGVGRRQRRQPRWRESPLARTR